MKARTAITRAKPLFVFDGHCVLCSSGASFIMRHDRHGAVQFASAQSELGIAIYRTLQMPIDDSYVLIDNEGCHIKSDGYFRLARILGGWWRLACIGRMIPALSGIGLTISSREIVIAGSAGPISATC